VAWLDGRATTHRARSNSLWSSGIKEICTTQIRKRVCALFTDAHWLTVLRNSSFNTRCPIRLVSRTSEVEPEWCAC
jgi:hypothetical protein